MNPSTSSDALAQLQQKQQSAASLADLGKQAEQQFGVGQAREQVSGLRGAITNTTNLLKQVAPSIMGRTGGSLVTAAQAARQIQNEQAPLSEQLGQQSQDYGLASSDLSDILSRAQQQASAQYGDQQQQVSYLQNLYNTLYEREQAAETARQAELNRQEQIRQFNEQLALERANASRSSGAAGLFSGLSGGSSGATPQSVPQNQVKQKATADVQQLLNRAGTKSFLDEIQAIAKSAGYGNTYDQAKLELIRGAQPGLFSGGKLNTARIQSLYSVYGGGGNSKSSQPKFRSGF